MQKFFAVLCLALASCGAPDDDTAATPEWLTVFAQPFVMGSSYSEAGRSTDEQQHVVDFSFNFEMLSVAVTQAEFERLMGYDPTSEPECTGACPVGNITWHEAAAYCNTLSEEDGYYTCYVCTGTAPDVTCEPDTTWALPQHCPGYRLPTEAEWEYSARAGEQAPPNAGRLVTDGQQLLDCESPHAGLDGLAWFCGNSDGRARPVGSSGQNAWGFWDMLGNRLEATSDWYEPFTVAAVTDIGGPAAGILKVYRGGHALGYASGCRESARHPYSPEARFPELGLRPVRSLR